MRHISLPVTSIRFFNKYFSLVPTKRYFSQSYDGTPHSLAHSDLGDAALVKNIETVDLAFDIHKANDPIGPPLIFLHGLFGSKANNRSISRQLVKKIQRDIYCLDLRNHGDSPHHHIHNYPSMAADVEKFIRDRKIENSIVIGHSMGAKTAMALVLRNKNICKGMVAVDNAPVDFTFGGTGFSKFGKYIKQLKKIESKELKSLKECDEILAEVEDQLPVRQFLMTNLKKKENGKGYYCRVPLDIMGKELDNVSSWPFNYTKSRWNGNSLFIRGTQSAYVADEYISSIGLFYPSFELEDVDAGHWLISEKPHEFLNILSRWIERHEE
ncbi:Imo32 protein [Martiniozyma asiatica (nom. inval.)]|nr:Imo32 protein [Martiniozyma asiatica]